MHKKGVQNCGKGKKSETSLTERWFFDKIPRGKSGNVSGKVFRKNDKKTDKQTGGGAL